MSKLIPGVNDLATIRPELAAEWHPTKNGDLLPSQVMYGTGKKVWWLCPLCGCEWQATINSRSRPGGVGCPACDKERKSSFQEQTIFFYLNQLTPTENRYKLQGETEIDIYLPDYKLGIEYDGANWHQDIQKDLSKNRFCERAGVRLIRIREPGCPALPVECIVLQSLADNALEEAIKHICAILGETVDINIDRDRSQIYEQYIENKKANSLAVKYPVIAAEWHPTKNGSFLPFQILPVSHKKVWWLGECGHEWQAPVYNRIAGSGCPVCSGHKCVPGTNDLATTHPELAVEWHPTKNGNLTPDKIVAGGGKKPWWQCSKGHEWKTTISHRLEGTGCPYCSGRRLLPGTNDLAAKNPKLAAEWHPTKNGDLLPSQVLPGTIRKVWWLCPVCGHEWQAPIANRNRGNGCLICYRESRKKK